MAQVDPNKVRGYAKATSTSVRTRNVTDKEYASQLLKTIRDKTVKVKNIPDSSLERILKLKEVNELADEFITSNHYRNFRPKEDNGIFNDFIKTRLKNLKLNNISIDDFLNNAFKDETWKSWKNTRVTALISRLANITLNKSLNQDQISKKENIENQIKDLATSKYFDTSQITKELLELEESFLPKDSPGIPPTRKPRTSTFNADNAKKSSTSYQFFQDERNLAHPNTVARHERDNQTDVLDVNSNTTDKQVNSIPKWYLYLSNPSEHYNNYSSDREYTGHVFKVAIIVIDRIIHHLNEHVKKSFIKDGSNPERSQNVYIYIPKKLQSTYLDNIREPRDKLLLLTPTFSSLGSPLPSTETYYSESNNDNYINTFREILDVAMLNEALLQKSLTSGKLKDTEKTKRTNLEKHMKLGKNTLNTMLVDYYLDDIVELLKTYVDFAYDLQTKMIKEDIPLKYK